MPVRFESNAKNAARVIAKLPRELSKLGVSRLQSAAAFFTKRMKKPGKKSTSPVNWDSENQRRAFFASDGFGGGIPHVRKNDYINAWQIQKIQTGAVSQNRSGVTRYISGLFEGSGQSRIHRGRWDKLRDNAIASVEYLRKNLARDLNNLAKRVTRQ